MEAGFTEGEFYQDHFDSRAYINIFFSSPEGHSDEKSLLVFVLDALSRTFSGGKYSGQKLVEVGSGPTIHSIISASEHFQEITLSDYAERNLEEIQKWLRNEEGCFNWNPVIEYICKLEKKSPSEVEAKIRQRVKHILKCDVRLENPFHPENLKPADCVITSLCLEAACKDMQAYKKALAGLASLLRPNGALVMVGVLGESFYVVNQTRFSCLPLTEQNIKEYLKDVGFTVHEFEIFSGPKPENNEVSDYEAVFQLVALKTS
ncbi:nicotinamide N-methyltransferase [Astyanax mexicanus]|uniref:Zgc:64002 n=1 Tax=Astyanax mexicanus TaxID=7994 RepID=A0A3B1JJZ0_ASTMX|nr:nicotinamide N-methyltransferase [Astyanax mexicanus]